MNKKCQVFTPPGYVEKMLDRVGYEHNLYGKKIMENSCGDGNILVVVVQRYIEDCVTYGLSRIKIRNGLARDIYGVEIDREQFEKCLARLDEVVKKYDIGKVRWNISCNDYLKMDDILKFDYVVGNPPYITYSELKEDDREYLKKNFGSCAKGKFDYCYAFLEKSIDSLSLHGRMAYLIPSSVYKTVFGEGIRKKMLPIVVDVIDYTNEKLFADALVKSSIIVLDKSKQDDEFSYIDESKEYKRQLKHSYLGTKWSFGEENVGEKRFGDYFKVSHVVATLCNKAFILNKWRINQNGDYVIDEYTVEKEMVRETASPKNCRINKMQKIIFPYSYDENHRLIRYSEEEFCSNYPGTCNYLNHYRKALDNRNSDFDAKWFEYGRSQALGHLDCEKAIISTIISSEVFVYQLSSKCIPYSGMYICPITNEFQIKDAISILTQKEFLYYARDIGIPINGNSVRLTSKDIENYVFSSD